MKTFWIILAIIVIIFSSVWFFLLRDKKPATDETPINTAVPSLYDASINPPELTGYKFKFGSNLELSYPKNWSLSEGESNSNDSQIVTIESPKDDNGHYFCLNLDEFGPANTIDLKLTNVNVSNAMQFTASGIGKPLNLITYYPAGRMQPRLTLIDSLDVNKQNKDFDGSITNPSGRRVQISGRFDCREESQPQLTVEQFEQAHWYQVALKALVSLKY